MSGNHNAEAGTLAGRVKLAMQLCPGGPIKAIELARRARMSRSALSLITNGTTQNPSGGSLLELAVALRVKPEWLQLGTGPMTEGAELAARTANEGSPPTDGETPTLTLAERFIAARERTGLTPAAFAKAIGLSRAAVYLIEDGTTKNLKHKTALRAAKLAGVSPEWIAGAREKPVMDAPSSEGYSIQVLFRAQVDGQHKAIAVVDSATNRRQPELMAELLREHQRLGKGDMVRVVAIRLDAEALNDLLASNPPEIDGQLAATQ